MAYLGEGVKILVAEAAGQVQSLFFILLFLVQALEEGDHMTSLIIRHIQRLLRKIIPDRKVRPLHCFVCRLRILSGKLPRLRLETELLRAQVCDVDLGSSLCDLAHEPLSHLVARFFGEDGSRR